MSESIKIEVSDSQGAPKRYSFPGDGPVVIGRAADCDVVIDSMEVSRRHAELFQGAEGVCVRDLSANGILVDGVAVESQRALLSGQPFYIGHAQLVCRFGAGAGAPRNDLVETKRKLIRQLVECVDLDFLGEDSVSLRLRVVSALERMVATADLPADVNRGELIGELVDEAVGLGPLEMLMADPDVSEVMVVDYQNIYVERHGLVELTNRTFSSEEAVRMIIERIVTPLGRRIDQSSPMVDARLPDGSRVNAVIPPLALNGSCLTIRKFASTPLDIDKLVSYGTLDRLVAGFLVGAVEERANIVISGGTGSGKTTLLNVLAGSIPAGERIVTIEDAAELQLPQPHVVPLESKPANIENRGEITIRDLVRNALRMRPDRIVVGECRGGEALDMLQAMNTGHSGSLTTTHANTPREAIARLETLALMAGVDLPARAIREQIANAVDLIVQQARLPDGTRRITSVAEIAGMEDDGRVALKEVFRFDPREAGGSGGFAATGWLSRYFTEGLFDAIRGDGIERES